MPENGEARDALVNRQLPEMQLSDGSSSSLTAPPPPPPHYLNAEGRAAYRFNVEGNAISMLFMIDAKTHLLTIGLVTGGAGTLALEGARALLEHGLSGLALFDLNPQQSAAAIDALIKDFPDAKIITKKVDVRDAESIGTAVKETAEELGSVDVLCCFAGVVGCTHALDMSLEEWKRTMDINSTGSFLCAQAVAK